MTQLGQHETSAADAVDLAIRGRGDRKARARGGGHSPPEVQPENDEPSLQQRLLLIETELRAAQDQRKKLEERVGGAEARADAAEKRLRAEVGKVSKELAELAGRLELVEGGGLVEHVQVLRAQVDALARRIARRPIKRGWDVGLSFSFLTLP